MRFLSFASGDFGADTLKVGTPLGTKIKTHAGDAVGMRLLAVAGVLWIPIPSCRRLGPGPNRCDIESGRDANFDLK